VTYEKRRLVPGLESTVFTPGPGPRTLSNGIGLEICKDMDFHAMIRSDEVATKPELLAVPAWDFKEDDWSHARVAILRSDARRLAVAVYQHRNTTCCGNLPWTTIERVSPPHRCEDPTFSATSLR
jgi:hypothetical protein